jgi:RHS repeat-associated protein
VYLNGVPVLQVEGATKFYLHPDPLGTPRSATDSAKDVVWTWGGEAFGSNLPDEDPDNDATDTTVNLRFPGQYFDAETGHHYNYFRDYEPLMGRYVQSDPIGLAGGMNSYLYAGANVATYFDFFGLERRGRNTGHTGLLNPTRGRWGVFGCLIGCASFVQGDRTTQVSLSPTLGGGLMLCGPPVPVEDDNRSCPIPPNDFSDPRGDNAFGHGFGLSGPTTSRTPARLGLGIAENPDGSWCVLIGPFVGSGYSRSANMGDIDERSP